METDASLLFQLIIGSKSNHIYWIDFNLLAILIICKRNNDFLSL